MQPVRGTLTGHTFRSRALCKPMRLHIYLPPGYSSRGRAYPVVYLLHPWGQDEHYWTHVLGLHETADHLIDADALPPFVAVMPQGDKSFFINAEDPGGDFSPVQRLDPDFFDGALEGYGDYGDYVLQDVIPAIESRLPVRADRAGRVIAGISMGGTGAAVLGFTHPHLFGAVGIHSPALFDSGRLGPPWIFGLGDPLAFASRDPLSLACQLNPHSELSIYLDCGEDDEIAALAHRLHETLAARGIHHTYARRPGGHNLDYWHAHLAEYLGFYAAGW